MPPTPTIEDLEKDVAAKAQAVSDAQADHADAVTQLQAAKAAPVEQPQAESVPVSEVVPAPSAAPAAPELVPFDSPMHLVTKADPTQTFDPATGADIGSVPLNTKFEAIGKYETASGVYFSDGNLSVKTVDLGPDSSTAAAPESDEGEKVEVHVTPTPPPAPDAWKVMKKTYLGPVQYRVKGTFVLHDLSRDQSDVSVTPETHTQDKEGLDIGGEFIGPDGIEYYRPTSSIEKGTWYGFPVETLQPVGDPDDDLSQEEVQDIFNPQDAQATEAAAGYGKTNKIAATAGNTAGLINRLRGKKS